MYIYDFLKIFAKVFPEILNVEKSVKPKKTKTGVDLKKSLFAQNEAINFTKAKFVSIFKKFCCFLGCNLK